MKRWFAVLAILVFLGASAPVTGQGNGNIYQLIITCPGDALNARCPIQAVDGEDMMGDPSLAVDPFDTDRMIMASLHGTGGEDGPSERSRSGQAFTTFTSTNHGVSWTDNPFFPPPNLGFGAFGEHPQVTIDPLGFVYIGSMYSIEDGNDGYDYVIAAQNFTGISNINRAQNGVYNVKFIPTLYPKNVMEQFWYLYHPINDVMNMVWWERPPGEEPGQGFQQPANTELLESLTLDAPARKDAETEQEQEERESGAIGMVWKNRRNYYGQEQEDIIEPCDSATNPVRSGASIDIYGNQGAKKDDEKMYIACRVGEGNFRWDDNVDVGDFVLFRVNPNLENFTYLGKTPLNGGEAKLASRSDGRLAIATARINNGQLELFVAYGEDKGNKATWTGLESYGSKIEPLPQNRDLEEVNIQSMIYREYSGVLHLILKQVTSVRGSGIETVTSTIAPNIQKSLLAIDETYGLLADRDLDIGNPLNRTDPVLLTAPESAYNDISDGFLEMPPAPYSYNGEDLGDYTQEFFAIGDYGIVQFAEVVELTELRGPAFGQPPPPPTPIPAPAASTAISQVLVPAAGLTVAGLIAASFALNKNKSVNAAHAKGKK